MSKVIKKENHSLEVMGDNELQKKLKDGISKIEKELDKIQGNGNYVFQCPSNFKYNELDGNTVNIQTTEDLVYLMKALSLMRRVEEDYNANLDRLGIKKYPVCTWLGASTAAWIADLEVLVTRKLNKEKIQLLTGKVQELKTFLSQKERLLNVLESIGDIIK